MKLSEGLLPVAAAAISTLAGCHNNVVIPPWMGRSTNSISQGNQWPHQAEANTQAQSRSDAQAEQHFLSGTNDKEKWSTCIGKESEVRVPSPEIGNQCMATIEECRAILKSDPGIDEYKKCDDGLLVDALLALTDHSCTQYKRNSREEKKCQAIENNESSRFEADQAKCDEIKKNHPLVSVFQQCLQRVKKCTGGDVLSGSCSK